MTVFSAKNAGFEINGEPLLEKINITVFEKDKVGIIGANGVGKTTFVRMLIGEIKDYVGEIFFSSKLSVGYLAQNSGLSGDSTVMEEFLKTFSDLISLENEISECENSLAVSATDTEKTSQRLSVLYEKYRDGGGLTYRSRIAQILSGLGFSEEMYSRKISELSGGERTRLALGRIILSNPDVMILDEPTNHLDIDSVEWLEAELKKYAGTLLVISHDRAFLENVTSKTLIIEYNSAKIYNASYSAFVKLHKADKDYKQKCYEQQQKEIARIEGIIENQRKWNREKNIVTAESWQKKLDKMEIIEKDAPDETPPAINFRIDTLGGEDVLSVKNLSFTLPDGRNLFSEVSFDVFRKDHLFITGPNGCGKSTLLKIITSKMTSNINYSGSFMIGHNIKFAYYSQDMSDLSGGNTVFDEIFDYANYKYFNGHAGQSAFHSAVEIRKSLAAFGFKGDEVFKTIDCLSGGEKARIALLKITYDNAPLLILDEPTNHLDIETREALEDALLNFEGTVIAVSHDRYFVNKIMTRAINISDFAVRKAESNKSEEIKPSSEYNEYQKSRELRSQKTKLTTKCKRLEEEITGYEARLLEIEKELSSPENITDYQKLSALTSEQSELCEKLSVASDDYLIACEELEKMK